MLKTEKLAKVVRILTTVPVMAFLFLSILYKMRPELFGGIQHYILLIIFLVFISLLGYPLQPLIPPFCSQGRDGQRNLVILMSFVGYLCGIISALIFHAPATVFMIYLAYFISSVGIVIFNKFLKIKASGHSCGVTGPLSLLIFFIGLKGLLASLILIPVYWFSLKLKRHTLIQLVWGSVISIAAFIVAFFIIKIASPASL